jgi:hypothetical protein
MFVVVAAAAAVHFTGHAQAATAAAPSPAKPTASPGQPLQPGQDLNALRQQIDLAAQEILQARAVLNQIMFERVKSIKKRQGLTPDQAKAFDDAYAVELARVNRAQEQLNAARRLLAEREQAQPRQMPAVRPTGDANILGRLEALEQRVTALEAAIGSKHHEVP